MHRARGDDRDLVSLVGGPDDTQHNAAVTPFFGVDHHRTSTRRGRDDTVLRDLPEAFRTIGHVTIMLYRAKLTAATRWLVRRCPLLPLCGRVLGPSRVLARAPERGAVPGQRRS